MDGRTTGGSDGRQNGRTDGPDGDDRRSDGRSDGQTPIGQICVVFAVPKLSAVSVRVHQLGDGRDGAVQSGSQPLGQGLLPHRCRGENVFSHGASKTLNGLEFYFQNSRQRA